MSPSIAGAPEGAPSSRCTVMAAGVLLALATLAAYAGSFGGPFVYDDLSSIPDNLTLRHLWPTPGPCRHRTVASPSMAGRC